MIQRAGTARYFDKQATRSVYENLKPARGSEVLLMINGFSGTPLMELYVLYNKASYLLQQHGVSISHSLVGNYTTVLDMAGASVTVFLLDDEGCACAYASNVLG